MDKVSRVLPRTLTSLGLIKKYYAQVVIERWKTIVGDEIAKYAQANRCIRNIVYVNTASSVWSHHLLMLKGEIIDKLNRFIGENVVIDIKFQVGPLDEHNNNNESVDLVKDR